METRSSPQPIVVATGRGCICTWEVFPFETRPSHIAAFSWSRDSHPLDDRRDKCEHYERSSTPVHETLHTDETQMQRDRDRRNTGDVLRVVHKNHITATEIKKTIRSQRNHRTWEYDESDYTTSP